MKESIKGKWFLLIVAIVVTLLAIFLYHKGFRITYTPELENSWNAISVFAEWSNVLVSSLAVWAAIQIPKKIATDQNNVAVKEERLKIYFTIKNFSEDWAFYQTTIFESSHVNLIHLIQKKALNFLDENSYKKCQKAFNCYQFYFQKHQSTVQQLSYFHTEIFLLCQTINTMPELMTSPYNKEADLNSTMRKFVTFYNSSEFKNMISYMEQILKAPKNDQSI
ncbi:hypothetical protein [Intestinibacillus sp. Marseille-P6563]|uniref:hypothetical protein n=1 Tax=Intestinibacillus sp. Marseille-P6563 TaxID=2364792 RepID=UPI000F06D8DB|nr:hypothetical protein [Intestinibacillus sp. Marseille-P6563]